MIVEDWIKLICSSCNTKLKIQTEYAGRKGKCPCCDKRFPIPEESEDSFVFDLMKDLDDIDESEDFAPIDGEWDDGTKINMDDLLEDDKK